MLLEVRWDTRGSKETAAGRKRKTEAGPTPPQSKKKRKAPAGETFGQAERDNLLGVVSVEAYPYTALEKAQLDYVREQLMKSLEKSTACWLVGLNSDFNTNRSYHTFKLVVSHVQPTNATSD